MTESLTIYRPTTVPNRLAKDGNVFTLHPRAVEAEKPTFFLTQPSTRIRRAGQLVHTLRTTNRTPADLITNRLSPPLRAHFLPFEQGEAHVPLQRVYRAATHCFDEDAAEMVELAKQVEENRWMQTLTAGTFRKGGITLGRAITFVRLSNLQTKQAFVNQTGTSEVQIRKYERDQITPEPEVLNQMIEGAGIDPTGMPAQMMRLLREKRDPMELSELHTCTFEELFSYIRQVKGLSPHAVEKLINRRRSRGLVVAIEAGTQKTSEYMRNRLTHSLDLDPQSALAEIMYTKATKPTEYIKDELIQMVFSGDHDGQYVFAENLREVTTAQVPTTATILNTLEEKRGQTISDGQTNSVIGILLKYLREKKALGPRELARRAKMSHGDISRIERGEYPPQDITIMRLLQGMTYTVHHPVTWYLLDTADTLERRFK